MSPDGVFYLADIKVEENKIKAKLLYSGSICVSINKSLAAMSSDDNYYGALVQNFSVDSLLKRLDTSDKSSEELRSLEEKLTSCELLQYSAEVDFTIMYHNVRNKRKAVMIDISGCRRSLTPYQL